MSRSLNKVMLIGNVGNDPEIRSTSSGRRLANVSLATNERWTDNSGQQQEKTEWHRLTIWGRLVDVVEQYVKKGDRLFIEGSIKYSQTEGEGGTRYWTDINVRDMVMLGRGVGGEEAGNFTSKTESLPETQINEGNRESSLTKPDDALPF